jgi:hypothetical protein
MGLTTATPAFEVCKTMVRTMSDYAGRNAPETLNALSYGTYKALNAATNQSGAVDIPTTLFTNPTGDGETTNNRLSVKYRTRRCNDTVEVSLNPCEDEGVTHNAWAYKDFLFTTPVSHSFTIKNATMRNMCEGYSEEYASLLRETAETLLRKLNARYITQIATNFGKYWAADCTLAAVSDTDTESVAFFDTNGNPTPMGAFKVLQQYRRNGFQGNPLVIGGSAIDKFKFSNQFYRNNVDGFDGSILMDMQLFSDYQVDTVLDNASYSNLISIAPGAARPLFWNRFGGNQGYQSPTMVNTTLDIGALLGLGFSLLADHSLYVKECGTDIEYIHKFHIYSDLFMLTDDMLSDDCNQCSNGILLWNHDCADPSCLDLNPEILAPAD